MASIQLVDPNLRALDDAIRILREHRKAVAPGSPTIWRILDSACKHLDDQILHGVMEKAGLYSPSACGGTGAKEEHASCGRHHS